MKNVFAEERQFPYEKYDEEDGGVTPDAVVGNVVAYYDAKHGVLLVETASRSSRFYSSPALPPGKDLCFALNRAAAIRQAVAIADAWFSQCGDAASRLHEPDARQKAADLKAAREDTAAQRQAELEAANPNPVEF